MLWTDISVWASISVALVCISLLLLFFLVSVDDTDYNILVKFGIYATIAVGFYMLLVMFQENARMVKIDILDTIENTEKYNGFYSPFHILFVALTGSLIGIIYHIIVKKVKNYNMSRRRW